MLKSKQTSQNECTKHIHNYQPTQSNLIMNLYIFRTEQETALKIENGKNHWVIKAATACCWVKIVKQLKLNNNSYKIVHLTTLKKPLLLSCCGSGFISAACREGGHQHCLLASCQFHSFIL